MVRLIVTICCSLLLALPLYSDVTFNQKVAIASMAASSHPLETRKTNELTESSSTHQSSQSASPRFFHEHAIHQSPVFTPILISQILAQLDNYYIDEVNTDQMMEKALKTMFSQLDPYSTYLNETELKDMFSLANGHYTGLGVELDLDGQQVIIADVFKHSPAENAGIPKGATLMAINGVDITADNLDQVSKIIDEDEGQTLLVTWQSPTNREIHQSRISPATIMIDSVNTERHKHSIGYARITSFQANTADKLAESLLGLHQQDQLAGIVLDLRNNPGGVLDSAVEVSDLFLNSGNIVSTKGRYRGANQEFQATPGELFASLPIVVLINAKSASAAEIVAGALKAHERAIIVGTTSYGKGSVQSLIPVGDGSTAIKLTTAIYFTPDGRSIDGKGITPDITINQAIESAPAQVIIQNNQYLTADVNLQSEQDRQLAIAREIIKQRGSSR